MMNSPHGPMSFRVSGMPVIWPLVLKTADMGRFALLVLFWWGMSIVKFLFTPSAMMASTAAREESWIGHDWSMLEVILVTASGAALGVFVFYTFGERLLLYLDKRRKRPRRRFTRINRFIIRIKRKWGLKGLLLISGLISVPVTSLIAARYYRSPVTMPLLIMAFSVWAVFLTFLSYAVKLIF